MQKEKDASWQAIRGICIIAVIFIHCKSIQITTSSFESIFYVLYRNLINFPVAIFFFISGYFTRYQCGGYRYYLKSRIQRIIIPYLIWSVAFLLIDVLLKHETITVRYLIGVIFLGKAAVPYYYIVVLFYFTIIAPLLIRCSKYRFSPIFISAGALILQIVGYILQANAIPFFSNYLKYTPVWLPFYFFGIVAKQKKWTITETMIPANKCIFFLIGFFVLELIESVILLSNKSLSNIAFSQMRITGFIFAVAVLVFLIRLFKTKMPPQWIVRIGDYSFGIFLVHYLFIVLSSKLLGRLSLVLPVYILVEFLISLLGSIIFIFVVRRLFVNKKKVLACIGF